MLLKKVVKKLINLKIKIFINIFSKMKFGRYFLYRFNKNVVNRKKTINLGNQNLIFYIPNEINEFRINTFSTKEPETLNWIDNFNKNSTFFDIGANIGLYSCYAGKKIKCNTFSFEPSFFNLELLSKNIFVNKLSDLIKIVPVSLSSERKISEFNMSTTEWGGALSTFGENITYDGSKMKPIFKYKTISFTLTFCSTS